MAERKVYCEILEGVTFSDRCLFKLSKIIEGNKTCENCILRQFERMKSAKTKRSSDIKDRKKPKTIKNEGPKQMYSSQELTGLLGRSERRIRELAQEGKLSARKIGRHWEFPKEEIDKLLLEKKASSLHYNDVVMIPSEPSNGEGIPVPLDHIDEGSPNRLR